MDPEIIHQVVGSLNGQVHPVGESHGDETRLDNLNRLIELSDMILKDIVEVSTGKDSHLASVSKAGRAAQRYINSLEDFSE